jgi:heme/copper-type cytochrome/quinol oxidase subunit 2
VSIGRVILTSNPPPADVSSDIVSDLEAMIMMMMMMMIMMTMMMMTTTMMMGACRRVERHRERPGGAQGESPRGDGAGRP